MSLNRLRAAALCGFLLAASGGAHAQAFRAYVASYGSDSNPCSVTLPCRLLPAAINAVAEYGEVWMLDSANYNQGTVTISKSVSILAVPGQVGSVVAVNNGPAIVISNGGVALRNIVVANNAVNPGTHGIEVTSSDPVTIENSLITDIPDKAVYAHGSSARVLLTGTTIRNSTYGLYVVDSGVVQADHCKLLNDYYVMQASSASDQAVDIHLVDSVVQTSTMGLQAYSSSSVFNGRARIYLTRTSVSDVEFTALVAQSTGPGAAMFTLTGSTIASGHIPYSTTGANASVRSLGNNFIDGTGSGNFTTTALQ
jgi:hypothetical protein